MIRDLSLAEPGTTTIDTPVCLVGGGTAGIFLHQLLRGLGIDSVLLEAGDGTGRRPELVDQTCEQRGLFYRGADSGRCFGLGGTSTLWGGQLLSLSRSDLEPRPASGIAGWPISLDDLAPHFATVRTVLGLPASDADPGGAKHYPELDALSPDFQLRLSEWLPFRTRNFAHAFAEQLRSDSHTNVWLNAAVTSLSTQPSGNGLRVGSVEAQSSNGRRLSVRAREVVICAGALESTRLLLQADRDNDHAISRSGAPLGRYFSDHLSVTAGRLTCRDWRRFNLAIAPLFERGLMRTPRLELRREAQHSRGLTSAFAHFTFVTHGDTGFDVVRSLLRRRQGEQHPLSLHPEKLGRAAWDVGSMALWRFVHRRLWIPRQADLLLQVDVEQAPNPDSRILLTDDRDAFGRRRLAIDWRVLPQDVRVAREVATMIASAWHASPLGAMADLEVAFPERLDTFESLYDVYHPTGPVRMGTTGKDSVVDKDLRLWAMDNCYVASTAVFPSAGSANPGFTHLALTARLAEHLARRSAG